MEVDLLPLPLEKDEAIVSLQLPPLVYDEKLVDVLMQEHALIPKRPAITSMFAANAEQQDMSPQVVVQNDVRNFVSDPSKDVSRFQNLSSRPAYLRNFWWDEENEMPKLTLALASEVLPPLPPVPDNELRNTSLNNTLTTHSHLFDIVTPIRADVLESYLISHPNPPFVSSVCRGLTYGFWPWADTSKVILPYTHDVAEYTTNPAHLSFAEQQRETEITKGRFSKTFDRLLPGMMAVPISVATKPHSDKLRLCANHSAEPFSRNAMIDKANVAVPLDNLQLFGQALLRFRREVGRDAWLVAIKSDVKEAYRNCPMSKHWQAKQVLKINGRFNVDRNNEFGSRAAGGIWGSVLSLVLWIASFVLTISDLFAYVDDTFSFDLATRVLWYEPFKKFMPMKQVELLRLWDELGVPHDEAKQVSGPILTIIGFEVDVNAMSITMPSQSLLDLIAAISEFAVRGRRPKLSDYQSLAGWINWALNVYPLLRPCLSSLYAKIAGKNQPGREIYINNQICRELQWAVHHLQSSSGVFLLDSIDWSPLDAEYTLLTDACLFGMAFWSLRHRLGFQASIGSQSSHGIFFWEAYAVVSAFHWILHAIHPPPSRVVIYTDNTNTVDLFHTLRASPKLNPLAITTADLMMRFGCQLQVLHIAGDQNGVADSLSRFNNALAQAYVPTLQIQTFTPPHLSLGAEEL